MATLDTLTIAWNLTDAGTDPSSPTPSTSASVLALSGALLSPARSVLNALAVPVSLGPVHRDTDVVKIFPPCSSVEGRRGQHDDPV